MPSDDPPLLASLEELVIGLLSPAHMRSISHLVEPDLSLSQARILLTVGMAREPLPIHVIAEQIGLSLPATGRNVDQLVKLGVVSREEAVTDRRVKLITITDGGREAIAVLLEARRAAMRAFVLRVPQPQRDRLDDAIRAALDTGALHPAPEDLGAPR